MDDLDIEFYRRVRSGYLEMVAQDPARWVVVDAAHDAQMIAREIRERVEKRLVIRDA